MKLLAAHTSRMPADLEILAKDALSLLITSPS
jgi:hypothetical protein